MRHGRRLEARAANRIERNHHGNMRCSDRRDRVRIDRHLATRAQKLTSRARRQFREPQRDPAQDWRLALAIGIHNLPLRHRPYDAAEAQPQSGEQDKGVRRCPRKADFR
jgi:hypothetical protein